jgi:Flp pilus assembly pilin Flp
MNIFKKFILSEDGMQLAEYAIVLGVIFTVGAVGLSQLSVRISNLISQASTAIPS